MFDKLGFRSVGILRAIKIHDVHNAIPSNIEDDRAIFCGLSTQPIAEIYEFRAVCAL